MILVIFGGAVALKFEEHSLTPGVVETRAMTLAPIIPAGAALFREADGDLEELGRVIAIRPSKLERWRIEFMPAVGTTLITEEVAAQAATFPGHEIAELRPLLTPYLWGVVDSLAATVEKICELNDQALLDIDGVGPKSLQAIREACSQVLDDGN